MRMEEAKNTIIIMIRDDEDGDMKWANCNRVITEAEFVQGELTLSSIHRWALPPSPGMFYTNVPRNRVS